MRVDAVFGLLSRLPQRGDGLDTLPECVPRPYEHDDRAGDDSSCLFDERSAAIASKPSSTRPASSALAGSGASREPTAVRAGVQRDVEAGELAQIQVPSWPSWLRWRSAVRC